VLILIRASLIARTRGLIEIRPPLILVMPRLTAISRRVITD